MGLIIATDMAAIGEVVNSGAEYLLTLADSGKSSAALNYPLCFVERESGRKEASSPRTRSRRSRPESSSVRQVNLCGLKWCVLLV